MPSLLTTVITAFAVVSAFPTMPPAGVRTHASGLQSPSSDGTTVVGLVPWDRQTRLLGVSRDGGRPVVIPGTWPVSKLATPHIGTEYDGTLVVVYPLCEGRRGARCDLYESRLDGGGQHPVPGVNRANVSETQGAMDHGNVAFLRTARGFDGEASTYLRLRGGKARRLNYGGSSEVALAGDHVAQVRDVDPGYGMCGISAVQVLGVRGGVRRIKSAACGLNGQSLGSLNFTGGQLTFLSYNGADGPARTTIYRSASDGTDVVHARGPARAVAFAPTGPTTGVAVIAHEYSERKTTTTVSGLLFHP